MRTVQGWDLVRLRESREACAQFWGGSFRGVEIGNLDERQVAFVNDAEKCQPAAKMGTKAPKRADKSVF